MPELPEVETTKRALITHVKNTIIDNVLIRQAKLRWPITTNIKKLLAKRTILDISRRGKYLLFNLCDNNTLIIHLGMSGSLQIVYEDTELKKHDHVDIVLNNNKIIRYNDPRRFGAILLANNINDHVLLKHLGPEPLTEQFNADYLSSLAKNRKTPVKNFIMNNKTVVGVGNIYATEALFYARINPLKPITEINKKQWQLLVTEIKKILLKAIERGGTTLKNFINSDGKPGYFKQELAAYGKAQQPCLCCAKPLISIRQQGRATVYCHYCQT